MSLQVFLQAQLLGATEFLTAEPRAQTAHIETEETAAELLTADSRDLEGRCAWLTLLGEVLPRALLAELKLSRMLLGSSSAEQFLLVLAEEDIPRANDFLAHAAGSLARLSDNALRLVWASTENLGAWPVVRQRLRDALDDSLCCPLQPERFAADDWFAPFTPAASETDPVSFAAFANGLISASTVGWDPDERALLRWDAGRYTWPLREHSNLEEDSILFPRRIAMDEEGAVPAAPAELAERAEGADRWGILCGDVDHFAVQLGRAGSVEDHIHLSSLFKEFFAGELAVLCALPDFWRKITVLYRGGDDFAVMGSWDALILLARELQRLFEKFAEAHLSGLPGVESKSVSMALALAPEPRTEPARVMAAAAASLRLTKASALGLLHIFDRMLEWKRLADAEELQSGLVRLVREFQYPPAYLNDLAAVYRETAGARGGGGGGGGAGRRARSQRGDKPWRTYLRLSRVIPPGRGREQISVRNAVIANLIGKRTAHAKLRPSGRVGLEWARLTASA